MIKILFTLLITSFAFAANFHEFKINSYQGDEIDFAKFKGHPVMIVNIATRCGYTGQLDDIEKLYQKYKSKGLIVLGIPSNDFGGQTPENNKAVADFCRRNYGATFPITEKQVVSGNEKNAIYKYISSQTKNEVKWNFEKVIFDSKGNLIKKYPSSIAPLDTSITRGIEKLF